MRTALLLGLIWSGLWMAFLYVIMKCFPWEMLHDYPEDVRRASTLPEPTGKQKRKDIQRDRINHYLRSTDSVWTPPFPCGEGRFSNAVLVPVHHCDELECDRPFGHGLAPGLHGAPRMADHTGNGKLQQLQRLRISLQRLPDRLHLYDHNGTDFCGN